MIMNDNVGRMSKVKERFLLARCERDKRQIAGALDGLGKHALMVSAGARPSAVLNLSLGVLRLSQ